MKLSVVFPLLNESESLVELCREIITTHQGHIWAEANPEGGSDLIVLLPVSSK